MTKEYERKEDVYKKAAEDAIVDKNLDELKKALGATYEVRQERSLGLGERNVGANDGFYDQIKHLDDNNKRDLLVYAVEQSSFECANYLLNATDSHDYTKSLNTLLSRNSTHESRAFARTLLEKVIEKFPREAKQLINWYSNLLNETDKKMIDEFATLKFQEWCQNEIKQLLEVKSHTQISYTMHMIDSSSLSNDEKRSFIEAATAGLNRCIRDASSVELLAMVHVIHTIPLLDKNSFDPTLSSQWLTKYQSSCEVLVTKQDKSASFDALLTQEAPDFLTVSDKTNFETYKTALNAQPCIDMIQALKSLKSKLNEYYRAAKGDEAKIGSTSRAKYDEIVRPLYTEIDVYLKKLVRNPAPDNVKTVLEEFEKYLDKKLQLNGIKEANKHQWVEGWGRSAVDRQFDGRLGMLLQSAKVRLEELKVGQTSTSTSTSTAAFFSAAQPRNDAPAQAGPYA